MPIRNSPQRAPKSTAGEVTAYRPLLLDLFSLYDLRGDGRIQEDAFVSAQRLASSILIRSDQDILAPVRPASMMVNKSPMRLTRGVSGGLELLAIGGGLSRCGSRSGLELAGSQVAGSPLTGRPASSLSSSMSMTSLEPDLKAPAPVRSPSFLAHVGGKFSVLDSEGRGFLTKDHFLRWQQSLLDASKKSFVIKRNRLEWLVQQLVKLDRTQGTSQAWREREAACRALQLQVEEAEAIRRHGSVQALGEAISMLERALRQAEIAVLNEARQLGERTRPQSLASKVQCHRQQLELWRSELVARQQLSADAEDFRETTTSRTSSKRLVAESCARQEAVPLRILQPSGADVEVKVVPSTTVADVRSQVAAMLGVRPYRVHLAREAGEQLDRCDSAGLQEIGVLNDACAEVPRLVVTFAPVDKWKEASKEELLSMAEANGLLDGARDTAQRLNEDDVRARFAPRLKLAEKATEDRKQKELQRSERLQQAIEAAKVEAASLAADPQRLVAKASDVEQVIARMAADASATEAEIARSLEAATGELEEAGKQVQQLSVRDVDQLAGMVGVPRPVMVFAQALCILFQEKPPVKLDSDGLRYHDYWACAKQLLSDPQLFNRFKTFDRDDVSEHTVQRLMPYIEGEEDFQLDQQQACSKTGYTLCLWIRAMVAYHQAVMAAETQKQVLERLRAELDEARAALEVWHEEARKALGLMDELAKP